MSLIYPLINVENLFGKDREKSDFLTPITDAQGSSTTAFYSISKPGNLPHIYRHNNCDVLSILLSGSGVYGIGNQRISARQGDCGFVTKGTEHFFANSSNDASLMVGFFIGAKDIDATGVEVTGSISTNELTNKNERNQVKQKDGFIVNIDDINPEDMDESDGWKITDFRLPISAKNGSSSTLFRARFMPGAIHKKHCHKNCDEIYYIISGHGLAGAGSDRVEVHGGHFHFIPKGVEHWLHNLSKTDPIEVVGVYCEAGSVADTGYVYMGDVTTKDLEERTK
ncbi:MAG TPA: cupin domain-containing protein [Rhodospirillales bacterium]|jgi:mannose-6-phosphate isomerase-like protein (cupin superfamily)|nr:cupin domain-containing protein [Rhodospirillales bacterium]HIL76164.1 cupin domain-containing protein [Rhodospirillales bacterium]